MRIICVLVFVCFSHVLFAQDDEKESRDVIAVGYQIGGYNLIGFDIEKRITNLVGLHGGAGFLGYTAGVKLHTGPSKNSLFVNLSYKDAGMGLLSVFASELGGRIPFVYGSENALHWQIGIAKIHKYDQDFANKLFKGSDAIPDYMLSLGIGVSW